MAQKREFQLHQSALSDIIKRQTGSLDRAILEAVMNSIDQTATHVNVVLENDKVIVTDNGGGFRTVEDIHNNFEVFSRPHDASEAKVFGAFRMGRGQLFSHGVNVWRTNSFRMTVDIESTGLDYTLEENLPQQDGCSITINLYNPMTTNELVGLIQNLSNNIRYVNCAVLVNGKQVSEAIDQRSWDIDEPDFVAALKPFGKLELYNQGVHVRTFEHASFHVGGVVVSTVPLHLTFSRNDVMNNCPVWARIKEKLAWQKEEYEQHAKREKAAKYREKRKAEGRVSAKKPYVSIPQRKNIIEKLYSALDNDTKLEAARELAEKNNWLTTPLFRVPKGGDMAWITFSTLQKRAADRGGRVVAGSVSEVLANKTRLALPLASCNFDDITDSYNSACQKVIAACNAIFYPGYPEMHLTCVSHDELVELAKTVAITKPTRDWTETEQAMIDAWTSTLTTWYDDKSTSFQNRFGHLFSDGIDIAHLGFDSVSIQNNRFLVNTTVATSYEAGVEFTINMLSCALEQALEKLKETNGKKLQIWLGYLPTLTNAAVSHCQDIAFAARQLDQNVRQNAARFLDKLNYLQQTAGVFSGTKEEIAKMEEQLVQLKKDCGVSCVQNEENAVACEPADASLEQEAVPF